MTTYTELIDGVSQRLQDAERDLERRNNKLVTLRSRVSAGERLDDNYITDAIEAKDKASAKVTRLRAEQASLIAERDEDDRIHALRSQIVEEYPSVRRQTASVQISHRDIYTREGAQRGERSFLADLFRSQVLRDPQASQRLAEHGQVMGVAAQTRDVSSANVAGFIPPQYLSAMFAEYARAGRPVANLATALPLPAQGMKVVVPRITTPTSVGVQAAEADTVTESSPDDTLLEVPVVTVAGFVDLSRQAVERGELVEEVVMSDLAAAYNTGLDAQCLNGSGSNGQHLGIRNTAAVNTVTYTSASPTLPELYAKLAAATGQIVSQRFTGPTHFVMNPVTWSWILAQLDADKRPLVLPGGNGPSNAYGTTEAPTYAGTGRDLLGLPVILDGNVGTGYGTGTNETEIYCVAASDMLLWEDDSKAPAQLRFDDVLSATLQVRLLAYGYSAFTAGRQPKAVSVVKGTGLAALIP